MDFDNLQQVTELAAIPPPPPKPAAKWNGWSAPLRGVAAGAAESGGFLADTLKGFGQVMSAAGADSAGGMFSTQSEAERRESEIQRARIAADGVDTDSNVGRSFRNVARDYRPDPATAGLAERLTFDLSRFLTKAVGYTVGAGPAAGPLMLGTDEAMQTADDLALQGVDKATRQKVGAVTGAAAAAGVVLPVAAPGSIAKTVGLWAVGGPGAFVAQQAATREILRNADYGALAEQYDPLDPVGWAMTLVPAGLAAWAVRGARAKPSNAGAKPEAAPLTAEQADAVMTHNLTVAQDVRDATSPTQAAKMMGRRELPTIEDPQMQRLPEVQRQKLVDSFAAADREKPAFDAAVRSIAEATGGRAKLADLKGLDRTVEKVLTDYAGDASRMKDILRATIVADSTDHAQRVLAQVQEQLQVTPGSLRNSLDSAVQTVDGYRDIKLNVDMNGHTAEIQINLPEMIAAKKEAHPLYKQAEKLRREMEGKVDPAGMQRISELQAQQRAIYDKAWNEATSSRKAAGDTSAPLRTAEADGKTRGGDVSQAMEYGTPGQSGLSETGTPSTSSSSALGPKSGSSMMTSDASILSDRPLAGEAAQDAATARSIGTRIAEVEAKTPDLVVGTDADGKPLTAKQVLERARKEAQEGTDAELGAADAPLLDVAANCALSTGTP